MLCQECPKKPFCSELCPEAIVFADQDYAPGAAAIPVDGIGKVTVMKQRVDFGTRPLLAADTAKVMEIKAGWDVRKAWSKVITPEAEADTFDLGDSADADSWDNDVPTNAAAGTVACSTGGTDAYATAGGKYYAADDYILLTPSAQLSALVIEVAIEVAVPF